MRPYIYCKMLIWLKKLEHYQVKKYKLFLKPYIKIEKTTIKFGGIKIKKQKFYLDKRPISIKKI